jgi:hypothetical protein
MVGWCAAEGGNPDRDIALLTEAIAALRTTQSRHFLSYLLGLLAEAQMKAGHHADAVKAVEDGIALVDALANATTAQSSIGCKVNCWCARRTARNARRKHRSAPPSTSLGNKGPQLRSKGQRKACAVGPDSVVLCGRPLILASRRQSHVS